MHGKVFLIKVPHFQYTPYRIISNLPLRDSVSFFSKPMMYIHICYWCRSM